MLCPGTKRGAICKNNMISWRFEAAEHEFGREWLSNCCEDSSSSSMNLCCYRQSFFCFYTREEGWFCMARAWRRQWRIDVNSNSIFFVYWLYGCHHQPLLTAKPVLLWQSKQRPSLSLSCHVPCFKLLAEGEGRAVSSEPMKLFDSLFLSSFSNFIYSLNLSCLPFSLIENLMIWSSPLF